ncbi:MAG TPA: hypothetical protein VHG51_16935, partial [Longimicrobiaceae bacterium]|nr:hypothetical protein [Longimicrobiaceae bacterium]
MSRATRRISEVMPDDAALFDGEFEMEGEIAVRSRDLGGAGDLRRMEFELRSEGGHASYTVLGREHFYADWGTYDFRRGLVYSARLDQPFVEMHFQLAGSAHAAQS